MKIVILDAYTLNPGDLDWGAIEQLGDCTIYDRSTPDQVLERIGSAEIVITNKVLLTKEHFKALPQLRYVGVLATGYNVVDVEAAKQQDIVVTNIPGYSTASVAQATFALLLELTQQIGHQNDRVHSGAWVGARDFCFWDNPLTELDGLTLGLIGQGTIGQAVATIGQAFGMKVIAATRTPRESEFIRAVDVETVFQESDVLSLHCPLTEVTHQLVNNERLGWMKSSAFLINTARGPLIDEAALAAALNAGQLAGAGLDVLSTEPPAADNPLLTAKNCIISPHTAWATQASRSRLLTIATHNIAAFQAGEPVNCV